jgi:hypothetical protein
VQLKSAEGWLGGQVGVGMMAKHIGKSVNVRLNLDLADAVDAGPEEIAELEGVGHAVMEKFELWMELC